MFPTVMNSLFVGVFSFSLICESVTSQFLSFVPHGEKTLVKKGLLRRGQRKVGVSEGLPTLVTLYLFFVGTTNIFRAYPFTLKISDGTVFWNTSRPHILQLSEALLEEQEQALSPYCHFLSLLIFQKTPHCTRKQRSRLLWNCWIQRSPEDSKPNENNNTLFSLAKSTTRCIKFTKRVEL